MAGNAAPATVTITGTTGPGSAVTALKFIDVNDIEFDFYHNIIKVNRAGSGSTQIYDYSAINTVTLTISAGVTAIVIST
jgi:hypothetical protein